MATRCPECGKSFTLRQALCDDWRDPNRAFGCPHCGTFFTKDMRPNGKAALTVAVLMLGVGFPTLILLSRALTENDNGLLWLSIWIALGSFALVFIDGVREMMTRSELQKVDTVSEKNHSP